MKSYCQLSMNCNMCTLSTFVIYLRKHDKNCKITLLLNIHVNSKYKFQQNEGTLNN